MLLINFVRSLITTLGCLAIWLSRDLEPQWLLAAFVLVMTVVFTLGDLAEAKLIQLFNR